MGILLDLFKARNEAGTHFAIKNKSVSFFGLPMRPPHGINHMQAFSRTAISNRIDLFKEKKQILMSFFMVAFLYFLGICTYRFKQNLLLSTETIAGKMNLDKTEMSENPFTTLPWRLSVG